VIAQTRSGLYPKLVFIANGGMLLLVTYMLISALNFVSRFNIPTTWEQATGAVFLGGELLIVVCSLIANIVALLLDRGNRGLSAPPSYRG